MKIKLKPCPFCGGSTLVDIHFSNPDYVTFFESKLNESCILCIKCGSRGPTKWYRDNQEHLMNWNKRAEVEHDT